MNRLSTLPRMITIGGSAGALGPLIQVLAALPSDFPAPVFVVIHTPAESPGLLPDIVGRSCALHVVHAEDGAAIEPGYVYVARPGYHLLVTGDGMKVDRGPRENRARPAIDPLFRTAARAFGPRVVGVLLSGALNDGTYGLMAIKRHGGTAVVQHPEQAAYPEMPRSALDDVEVDHVLPAIEIAELLKRLALQPETATPGGMRGELGRADPAEEPSADTLEDPPAGEPAPFVCPDCGGALWETRQGGLTRYRCHVGHAFTGDVLLAGMQEELEGAFWSALRTVEENIALYRRLAGHAREAGHERRARQHEEHAAEMEQRAELLRRLLNPARAAREEAR